MDLNAVLLLSSVIEQKSFSKASNITGVPTSTISRKISQLEKDLNIQLLERTTRKLRLTEKGRVFYEQTQPAINILLAAQQNAADKETEISGTLRLSIPPGLEKSLILPLLFNFKKEYPQICLKVIATGNNLKFVEDGIDVALRLGKLADSNNIAHTLIEYEHILVASPDYIKQYGMPLEPTDLPNHRLICATNWLNDTRWRFLKKDKMVSIDIKESISLNHYVAMQLATEKGMGICELPSVNCIDALQNKKLVSVLSTWNLSVYGENKLGLSIVYTSNRYNSAVIKNFKNFCINYFKQTNLTL
ncbi:Transcriptional regulator, LysR family [hydrothermal vent metagenome]|uniref:Transcriptional regulator, LysR family n=1 Tax=hydrothermal vent metagenome TaxID=652676 RepID=A0A3B0WKM5_9ZZZZ